MTAVLSAPDPTTALPPTEPASDKRSKRGRRGFWAGVRSVLFWSHLVMGTLGGIIILIMSMTGVLLGFERQIIARFDGVARAVPPAATAQRLPLDTLFRRGGLEPGSVASVVLKADRTEPVSVRFRERERPAALLNPYTGTVIPSVPRGDAAAAMSWLRGWHRWLGVTGEQRPLMRKITGAANIAFLLLVLSGLYIWWPRRLSTAAFRTAAVFNPRLGGKARDFNWHNSLGFWSAIPLAFVIATGVFISYAWPGQWMDRLWGSESERAAAIKAMNQPAVAEGGGRGGRGAEGRSAGGAPSGRGGRSGEGLAEGRGASSPGTEGSDDPMKPTAEAPRAVASLDAMLLVVEEARPAWKSITITTAGPRDSVVQLAVAEGNTYRPDLKSQFFFNAESGVRTRVANFDSLSTSRKIRGWTRFGHTGEIFGVTGQVIATFVSFVGVILVWTGLALAWRRLVAFMSRRQRERAVPATR